MGAARRAGWAALLLALACAGPAGAQDATAATPAAPAPAAAQDEAPAAETPAIEVQGVRDPAMLPYRRGYEMGRRLQALASERVELLFRVVSSRTEEPVPGLRITIEGSRSYGALDISPEGFFVIPLVDAAYEDHADFVTNQKKGSLKLGLILRPRLPPQGLRYAMLVESIEAARRTMKEVVPWYLRLLLPRIQAVGLCYPQAGASVQAGDGPAQRREAATPDTDDLGRKVQCANFRADEAGLAPDTPIEPSAGWEAIYVGSYF